VHLALHEEMPEFDLHISGMNGGVEEVTIAKIMNSCAPCAAWLWAAKNQADRYLRFLFML